MALMTDRRNQAVTGLTPPQLDEARIRVVWPSVAAHTGIATLGRALTRTIVLAPLAWLIMALPYFMKVLPGMARRYTLTNRRLMVQHGWKLTPAQEVALADIDDVRIVEDANSDFFRAATLEILSKGRVALRLRGVPNPGSFREAILNATKAWVPGKADTGHFIPASASKSA
ncbi:MAG TPA: PH domain-containing protein [Gemmataceae bacterium]|nr:PH domain-containing protein [Gemmataceae bacterium]